VEAVKPRLTAAQRKLVTACVAQGVREVFLDVVVAPLDRMIADEERRVADLCMRRDELRAKRDDLLMERAGMLAACAYAGIDV
jgi:hypothetical protein